MFKTHQINEKNVVEVITEDNIISNIEDGTDLLGNMYYQGFDTIIIHQKNITPDFFDLKTKIAGEILQKFSNYRIRLFIIGDFEKLKSKSLQDFIRESNHGKTVNFVKNIEEVKTRLS